MDQLVETNCSIHLRNNSAHGKQYDVLTLCVAAVDFFFFLVGVPGNASILAVNRRRAVKTGTRVFMSALAVTDLALCGLRLFDAACVLLVGDLSLSYKPECLKLLENLSITLDMGLIQSSAFSAVIIAFNRCHAVCHPHSRRISPRKALLMSVACVVMAFIVKVSGLIIVVISKKNKVVWAYSELLPLTMYIASMFLVVCFYGKILYFLRGRAKILAQPKGGGNDQQPDESTLTGSVGTRHAHLTNDAESQSTNVRGIVFKGSPKLSDLTTSECAEGQPNNGQFLKGASPFRQNSGEASPRPNLVKKPSGLPVEKQSQGPQVRPKKASNKITTNLLLVTMSFFVLSLPFIGLNIAIIRETFKSGGKHNKDDVLKPKWILMWHLVFLKSVLNPFIYGLVDARFRAECRALLRRLKCCHRNP